jgi:hypothetical protein
MPGTKQEENQKLIQKIIVKYSQKLIYTKHVLFGTEFSAGSVVTKFSASIRPFMNKITNYYQ